LSKPLTTEEKSVSTLSALSCLNSRRKGKKTKEINMTKNKIKANMMKERANEWNENREQEKNQ
jgi:hypothetical protein